MEQVRQGAQVNRNTKNGYTHAGQYRQGMSEGCPATFQACQNPNSFVGADIWLTVLWAPSFALEHGPLRKLTTTATVQKKTRIAHNNGCAVTVLPAPCRVAGQHAGPARLPPERDGT